MTAPLVSCIVPVYNGERYLRESVDSILAQTYRPLEVVVADDGSTDGTAGIARSYGALATYLWQPNAGPAAACNLGLHASRGEFVAFLAADDLWHPEKLARQMIRFQARPDLDLCVTHIQNFWAPELAAEEAELRDHRLARPLPGYTLVTLVARRAIFETVGDLDPSLRHGDGTDWFLRAAERDAVMEMLPEVLVYRRLHPANRSRHLADHSRQTYLRIVKASLDRRRRRGDDAAAPYGFPGPPGYGA